MKRRDCLAAFAGGLALAGLRPSLAASGTVFPASVSQGALVIGKLAAGSRASYRGRALRVTPYGSVVFGVGRDEAGPLLIEATAGNGAVESISIAVTARDWPVERVSGVPAKTVDPPPAIAERIAREQKRVAAARDRDDDRADFAERFIWPVQGRISGRFGNQRIYNGKPGSPHSGMDIAVPTGTTVKAPASGVITFADPDLYLTGGTLLLDHGHGVSSNFLHLSRIDVKLGDRIEQGQAIAAVGATGRASGPHLHWGMGWFDVRTDPLLVARLDRLNGNGSPQRTQRAQREADWGDSLKGAQVALQRASTHYRPNATGFHSLAVLASLPFALFASFADQILLKPQPAYWRVAAFTVSATAATAAPSTSTTAPSLSAA